MQRARPVVRLEGQGGAPLAVAAIEACVRRERCESRVRGVVADVVREHDEPVHPCRARTRDRDDGRIPELSDRRGGIARGCCDDRRRPGERREQLATLVERDRMRVDLPDVLEATCAGPTRQCLIGRIASATIESAES